MNEITQIYVYILDEGTDVWRPVWAKNLGNSLFEITSINQDVDDEKWQFAYGDVVRCERQSLSSTDCLVAVEKVR